MRRSPALLAILVLIGTVGFIAGRLAPSTAHEATPAPDGLSFVGTWRATATVPGQPPQIGLATFDSDGTFVGGGLLVAPAPPGMPFTQVFTSPGQGVWMSTGPDSGTATILALQADERGTFLGTVTYVVSATLDADGHSLSGEFTASVADPTGTEVAAFTGTIAATRVTLQPLGTPVATAGA